MLVFAQVSSTKTRRPGSTRCWWRFHRSRLRATSERSCSLARRLFFEGEPLFAQEAPYRVVADLGAPLSQFGPQRLTGQIGRRRNPRQKPLALSQQGKTPPSAHRLGRLLARGAIVLHPQDDRRYADVEEAGHRAAGLTRLDQSDRSLAKIRRIGPWHSLLASNPASSLNHISPRAGIPSDSIGSGYALGGLDFNCSHRPRAEHSMRPRE